MIIKAEAESLKVDLDINIGASNEYSDYPQAIDNDEW